jgi:formylglycine-generating enzyme required for sulfatase activity
MGKKLNILRILLDLGLVGIIVTVILLKLFTGNNDSGSAENPAVAAKPIEVMTNSIGMTLAKIAAGSFSMGSSSYSKETAVHTVNFAADFWLGQYEVTQAQYRQVMETSPSRFQGDTLPAERVSWEDAAEFCRRLGARENKTYRLPTEAEWEYACRAGSRAAFCFGDDDSRLGEYAWYDGSAGNKTHPVGSRKPNAWGLYDMHGNVWEWCSDWYQEGYYLASPATDPKGPDSGQFRVLRGGCWYNRPVMCRSTRRDFNRSDYRDDGVGFRVVLVVR